MKLLLLIMLNVLLTAALCLSVYSEDNMGAVCIMCVMVFVNLFDKNTPRKV